MGAVFFRDRGDGQMTQKTVRVEKQTYFVHQAGNWKFLVKQDSNSGIYVPICRKGWEDGGEVEIFSLLPPAEAGDEFLLHVRVYTKASEADRVPALPNPPISIQALVPIFTFVEPEKQRVRIQLMCTLIMEDRRLKVVPVMEQEDFE